MDSVNKSKTLSEEDVGISQYCGDHEGFFGIIKQRFVCLYVFYSFRLISVKLSPTDSYSVI